MSPARGMNHHWSSQTPRKRTTMRIVAELQTVRNLYRTVQRTISQEQCRETWSAAFSIRLQGVPKGGPE
jgi:hypothetical protein